MVDRRDPPETPTGLTRRALTARLGRGVFWSALGSAVAQVTLLVANYPIARILGVTAYGDFTLVQQVVLTVSGIVGPAIGLSATKYVAELRDREPGRAGRVMALTGASASAFAFLLGIALLASAPEVARSFEAPRLGPSFAVGSAALFVWSLNGVQTGTLAGFEAFRAITAVAIVRGLATAVAMLVLTSTHGVVGTVAGLGAGGLAGCIAATMAIRSSARRAGVRIDFRGAWRERGVLWGYSLPTVVASLAASAAVIFGTVYVRAQPGGDEALGQFGAANTWRMAILFVPSIIGQPFVSVMSNLLGNGERRRAWRVAWAGLGVATLAALVPASVVVAAAPAVMSGFGAGFGAGEGVLTVLAFSAVGTALASAVGSWMSALGDMWLAALFNVLWAGAFVAVLFGLPVSGAAGLAWAYAGSAGLHTLWTLAYMVFGPKGRGGAAG